MRKDKKWKDESAGKHVYYYYKPFFHGRYDDERGKNWDMIDRRRGCMYIQGGVERQAGKAEDVVVL